MKKSEPKRTSIYIAERINNMLNVDDVARESQSARISVMIEAAHITAKTECPALTKNEWVAICEAANGLMHDFSAGIEQVTRSLLFNLAESGLELDEKWSVDCRELASRLYNLPFPQRYAVYEIARAFWIKSDAMNEVENWTDALKKIGANVKEDS